jgi:hypothetical protein
MKHIRKGIVGLAMIAGSPFAQQSAFAADTDSSALDHFERRVRPLLVDNCYNCHSANTKAAGGLRVDDRNGLLVGGNNGKAVVPGKPEESLLIKAVEQHGDLKMPPKKHLSPEQIADLKQWITDGVAWPSVRIPGALAADRPNEEHEQLKATHWAFQPLSNAAAPTVRDTAWPRDDIDRFVLAALEAKGLRPVGDADKAALLRRVTFDLTGLPPTPEELRAFVDDPSTDAYERVVDRLLASPAFGERWGRHWLDVARYGESTGSSRNIPYPHAWRYRDYVIDSFNADKPFDRFIREQLAGDLLPAADQKQRDSQLIATGFLALGVKDVNQRFKVRFVMDNVDEQIDTVSRSFLALTASCARCHDHKFDPISQREYYALAGIFTSTDLCAGVRNLMGGGGLAYYDTSMLLPIGDRQAVRVEPATLAAKKKELEEARESWNKIRGTPEGLAKGDDGFPKQRPFRLRMEKLQAEYNALTDPTANGPVTFGVRDAKTPADTEVRVRGEAERLGPAVPRGFLSAVRVPNAKPVNPQQSGRLELADWIASPDNALTSRVFVNRAWHHLFGQGIVSTVDNFGVTGDVPSNPALLDHVARRFVADGWSVKKLVRTLVLTCTYRLSADKSDRAAAEDPANKLFWRHLPRRLTAEEIRDATLAASGQLNRYRPAGSPVMELPMIEQRNNGPESSRFAQLARESTTRSVYLPQVRGWVPTALEVFDFGDQGMVNGARDNTTVAPQALYLLNDPFVRKQSIALARRVLDRKDLDDSARINELYRLALGRTATTEELSDASEFLKAFEAEARTAWEATAHPAEARVASSAQPAAEPTPRPGKRANRNRQAVAAAPTTVPATQPTIAAASAVAGGPQQPAIDPDQVVTASEDVKEEVIRAESPRAAAWSAFSQALIGSAEFRYLQ